MRKLLYYSSRQQEIKKKKKKSKACSPSNWDLLFITNFMLVSVLNVKQMSILLTPHFCFCTLSCTMYIGGHLHAIEYTSIKKVILILWMILTKDSDIFFQINFSFCKVFKIYVFAFKMGFSFEKKSPGKGTPLFSF